MFRLFLGQPVRGRRSDWDRMRRAGVPEARRRDRPCQLPEQIQQQYTTLGP